MSVVNLMKTDSVITHSREDVAKEPGVPILFKATV